MKRLLALALVLGLGGLVFVGLGGGSSRAGGIGSFPAPYTPAKPTYPNTFFDSQCFSPGAKHSSEAESSTDIAPVPQPRPFGEIRGAVVPHHLLAHELIGEVFGHLREKASPLVVLIGPNHFNQGGRILTSSWGWQTPFGTVETDQDAVDWLLGTALVKEEPEVFAREHSMGNLMPFIKYYLPEAKVLPIILHHDVNRDEARQLANRLFSLADRGAVFVASVDFSHYLTREEAEQKDQETLEALKTGNLGRIFAMGNDYLDSPAAMGTLMYAMEKLDIDEFNLLDNTNSGILLGNDMIETTSYMTLIYEDVQ